MGEKVERLRIDLARTHVKQYLRKGESGKIENVEDYVRTGLPGVIRGKTAGGKTYVPKASTKRRSFRTGGEAKAVAGFVKREKAKSGFLGHDASGNEIKVGSPVKILAGPDKGNTAEVTGQSKGGGLSVRIGSGLQKRTAVVDPEEVRVMVRSFQPKR